MSKAAQNPFEKIYQRNSWRFGSGEGSLPQYNMGYVSFLESAEYRGFDIVQSVVDNNQSQYATPTISFQLYSGAPADLPRAELLLVKDVLQHLPNDQIREFLKHISRYKYVLITNCINPRGTTINSDVRVGKFRYLDLRLPPFNLKAKEVFSFSKPSSRLKQFLLGPNPKWKKSVLLLEGADGIPTASEVGGD